MFYRLVVPLHIAFKWISKFSIQILHYRQMFDRLATPCSIWQMQENKHSFIGPAVSSDIITGNEVHLEVNRCEVIS